MRRFAWEYVAAVATFVLFIVLLAFCVFLGRHADSYELDGTEFTAVDSKFTDRLMLCATRIHILEREVDMLKSRVDDLELYRGNGHMSPDSEFVGPSEHTDR